MNLIPGLLLLTAAPVLVWAAGAAPAHRLGLTAPGERLAAAVLLGLTVLLASLGWINLFLPLSPGAAWAALVPAVLPLLRPALLSAGWRDARQVLGGARGAVLAVSVTLFLTLLLWPLLSRSDVLYYDGTANHDGFFWISGADYLQQHAYLPPVAVSESHPYYNGVRALTGWQPGFGRMGAEAWVALTARLAGRPPLEIYLWASASLYVAWLAAVYLTARTFIADRLPGAALVALGLFQPLFAFSHHNANLPNLLGMLCGSLAVLGVARGLAETRPRQRMAWILAAALAGHGLLVSYSEMAPFVALPCLLLTLLAARRADAPGSSGTAIHFASLTVLAALALNPVTTARAASGFITAFQAARENATWANIFADTGATGALPAALTLSPKTGTELGAAGGAAVTLLLLGTAAWVIARARDRAGLLAGLAGAAALAAYTACTGFHYGWQKTIQFSAVALAALFSVGAFQLLLRVGRPGRALGALLAAFYVFAAAIGVLDLAKWSDRKHLDRDWLALIQADLPQPVRISPGSFSQSFFHGMWSTCFLRNQAVLFPDGSDPNAGYLLNTVATDASTPTPPASWLVSREWAETFEPQARVLVGGKRYRALAQSNQVVLVHGWQPRFGVPQQVAADFSLSATPIAPAELTLDLEDAGGRTGAWTVTVDTGEASRVLRVEGAGRWHLTVPLQPHRRQHLRFHFAPESAGAPETFFIKALRLGTAAPAGGPS